MSELWYHATDRSSALSIIADGVRLDLDHKRDPGDFGWGFYLTRDKRRASAIDRVLLQVEFQRDQCVYLENPYFMRDGRTFRPGTYIELLFHRLCFLERHRLDTRNEPQVMGTVHGTPQERTVVAKAIRGAFLLRGFRGIVTGHAGGEAVIFDPDILTSVELIGPAIEP